MVKKILDQIIDLWQVDKKQYVKKSTYSAYMLLVKNHLLPYFGDKEDVEETDVQDFVFKKLGVLIKKTIKHILIVLKMILKFGVKHTELIIDTPKTKNSIRDIPMTNDLHRILKPLKKIVNKDYYILTNDEKPIESCTYRNYYKRLIKRLGIPDLKFHGLRHSFATRCIEGKCDYKTVSVILGHSNISTTLNLYVHPNLEQKKTLY